MKTVTAEIKAKPADQVDRLPLLTPNEQKVLAALISLQKQRPGMVDFPKLVDLGAEIVRLGYERISTPAVQSNLKRLEDKGYVIRKPLEIRKPLDREAIA